MNRRGHVLAELIRAEGLSLGAEIGVRRGATAEILMRSCPKLRWIAVDIWVTMASDPARIAQEEHRAYFVGQVLPRYKRLTLLEHESAEAAAMVDDGSLDLVFIDACHQYAAVKRDIALWSPKVRPGGWITGHDFDNPRFPGVRRAVTEAFGEVQTREDYTWLVRQS